MSVEAELLRALQQAGVTLSRNRDFELFEGTAPPLGAWRLHKRIDAVARTLRHFGPRGELGMALEQAGTRFVLRVSMAILAYTQSLYLDGDELRLLAEQAGVARSFS